MNTIQMVPIISDSQIQTMSQLANQIWREHYIPIIGEEQVEYMLKKFQSPEAIKFQLTNDNYQCYFLNFNGINAGYIMFKIEDHKLFLSKIYIDKEYRKNKIGKSAIEFLISVCKEQDINSIWLTVNRNNTGSIAAYESMGFKTKKTQNSDIGMGYIMEDFIMEKKI